MAASQDDFQHKLLLTIILVLILPTCQGQQGPIVTTAAGRVRGSVISGVSFFSAIPYGAPPIGNLRFEVPQKAAPWQGVFDATQQGNSCIQFQFPPGTASIPESEDCLSLDVYVPRDLSSTRPGPTTLLPVLIYIHRGGFLYGSRANINATRMAKREGIIIVSINYRLGPLGFMALDDINIPGNVGLYDQRLAFQWVKENIRAFGGNPNKVIIFGKTTGSYTVSMHMLSPLSKGLFSGAIMSSGVYTVALRTRANASKVTMQVAANLGCDTSAPKTVLSCLRNQDTQTLLNAFGTQPSRHKVFVDGKFVVEQPIDTLMCGRFNRVPVIVGYNSENGQVNLDLFGSEYFNSGIPQNQIDDLIRAIITFAHPGTHPEEHRLILGNLTKAFYFNGDTSDPLVNLRSTLDFTRGLIWSSTALKFAKYLSKAGVPVYFYEFDERLLSDQGSPAAIPVGAYHIHDVPFVWGDIEDAGRFPQDSTPEKIQFAKDLGAAWGSFVRTGKPSLKNIRGQQLDWKAYTEDDPYYAHLKANMTTVKRDPAPKANLVWVKIESVVKEWKPDCSASRDTQPAIVPSGQPSWFWMYNWNPRGYWWRWWMSRS